MRAHLYWNSRKCLYSVRIDGKVERYTDAFIAFCADFHVSKAGVERIRASRRKEVIATISCNTSALHLCRPYLPYWDARRVTFNPYRDEAFVYADTLEPVPDAMLVTGYIRNGKPVILAQP